MSDAAAAAAVAARAALVRDTIASVCAQVGRPDTVRIVAVTKGHPTGAITAAVAAGLRDIGENRVQEAVAKMEELPPSLPCDWHLIGHLQSNKVRHVVGRFALIHSVDRRSLAEALSVKAGDRPQRVFLQVNVSREPQKSGVAPEQAQPLLDAMALLPGVHVEGLMTIARVDADELEQRRTFARLRELRDELASAERPLGELSMGMSQDYRAAVAEGATLVRLGSALFGERS